MMTFKRLDATTACNGSHSAALRYGARRQQAKPSSMRSVNGVAQIVCRITNFRLGEETSGSQKRINL